MTQPPEGLSEEYLIPRDAYRQIAAERDALLAWLDARPVFWIVFPPEDGLATAAKRVARTSPRSWERLAQVAIPHRHIPMSWVEQP